VIEHKGAEASALPAVSQAAVVATNFAMTLLKQGIPRREIIIPVIGHTGMSVVFGATIILEDSFPTYIPLSEHLSLSNPQQSKAAFAYFRKSSKHCKNFYEYLLTQTWSAVDWLTPPLQLRLDNDLFVKTIDLSTYKRGIGMFHANDSNPLEVDAGIWNLMTVLNLIYRDPAARSHVEYPLSIRSPDNASQNFYQIIYRNLVQAGYQIGAPNRMTDESLFDSYVAKLTQAINDIHKVGVIHVDLYLSNVMWRVIDSTEPSVDIKIIDWDASHALSRGDFHPNVKGKLVEYFGQGNVKFGVEHDLLYLGVLSLEKEEHAPLWQALSSNDKMTIDAAFRSLLTVQIEEQDDYKDAGG
jgi:serine/threonine protein kinase